MERPFIYPWVRKFYCDLQGFHSSTKMAELLLVSLGIEFPDFGLTKIEPKFFIIGMDDLTAVWKSIVLFTTSVTEAVEDIEDVKFHTSASMGTGPNTTIHFVLVGAPEATA